ncbi:phosphate/phosphite/phosphonate ABC transporter substrate-binding protein [Spirulina sp. CS-785/01]|uniref:phosphate/phosphite/phosphonate ABC transporter substrate-binding protein n=1 Tax=Spirulina sp. CS-785/01 TaxID=3021716 RepID=UPI00232FAAB6|nr:phosphate/phosphite/phosphonate ABC transporter substrate-binding protein [Spirulina sp. CS-785/01]MDB9312584.1 phosphate/phosphite/phosphonate ABC transporter substrate-binding protein [Spirulina sp. CS-785/01]
MQFPKLASLASLMLVFTVACSSTPPSTSESTVNDSETTETMESEAEIEVLKIAVIPSHSSDERKQKFDQLANYLKDQIGIPVTVELTETYDNLVQLMVDEEVMMAYFGTFSYVKAKAQNDHLEPLVAHIDEDSGRPWYSSVIVVRANSGIESLEDLKNKRFGFVSESSTSGFLVPSAAFKEAEIKPDTDFAEVKYAGGHDKNATALAQGEIDAAAMTYRTFQEATASGELPEGEYKVMWKSDPIPNSPYVINGKLSSDLKGQLQKAFINAPADIVGITNTESSGFTLVQDKDYEPIRRLQELVGVQED